MAGTYHPHRDPSDEGDGNARACLQDEPGVQTQGSACVRAVPVAPELEARAPTKRRARRDRVGAQRLQLPEVGRERGGCSKEEQEEALGARG